MLRCSFCGRSKQIKRLRLQGESETVINGVKISEPQHFLSPASEYRHHVCPLSKRKASGQSPGHRHRRLADHVSNLVPTGVTVTAAWTDFATGERSINHACEGHLDGWTDSDKTWRPTVTCPFHILATTDFAQYSTDQHSSATTRRSQRERNQAAVTMATAPIFPANEAATLLPLRQQIIGKIKCFSHHSKPTADLSL